VKRKKGKRRGKGKEREYSPHCGARAGWLGESLGGGKGEEERKEKGEKGGVYYYLLFSRSLAEMLEEEREGGGKEGVHLNFVLHQ